MFKQLTREELKKVLSNQTPLRRVESTLEPFSDEEIRMIFKKIPKIKKARSFVYRLLRARNCSEETRTLIRSYKRLFPDG